MSAAAWHIPNNMARRPRRVSEPPASYQTRVDQNGRVVLPAPVRHRLGVGPGDKVILRVEKGVVRVTTVQEAIREAQASVRRHIKSKASLVDSLLEWRRAEARRE